MAKFKIKYVKFIFTPSNRMRINWQDPLPTDYKFGNKHTDELDPIQYHRNDIGMLFGEYLDNDDRRYRRGAKFTESEAYILLLKYLEDNLKKSKKNFKHISGKDHVDEYYRKVTIRDLAHNTEAVKVIKKKVKEIKSSKEYLWEQLLK